MRILFLILSFFNLGAFADVKVEDFHNHIHQGYEVYEKIIDESNQYYSLRVYWGVNKNKVNYSIYFYNETPNALRLFIMTDNKGYTLPSDVRNDIAVLAFNTIKTDNLRLIIVDKDNHVYTEKKLITATDKESFLLNVNSPTSGLDEGLKTTKLKKYNAIKNYTVIIFALFSIIILSSAIITVLIITRKGVFNKDYVKVVPYIYSQSDSHDEYMREEEKIERPIEAIDDEPKTVYSKMIQYDDEFEFDFNVEDYLKEKGFNVNYKSLTEFEKERIMLELMMMRDTNIISVEQYNYEVIKLWS